MTFITLWLVGMSLVNGIGPVATAAAVRRCVVTVLPEQINGSIVELGAGWGGMTLMLAKRYPNNQIIALENNLPVWMVCWLRVKLAGLGNVVVRLKSIDDAPLEEAGLAYSYLFPEAMGKLAEQLKASHGRLLLISHTFALPEVEPEQVIRATDLWRSRIYVYRFSSSLPS